MYFEDEEMVQRVKERLRKHLARNGFNLARYAVAIPLVVQSLLMVAQLEDEAAVEGLDPTEAPEFRKARRGARRIMAQYKIIPKRRIELCQVDEHGRDTDLRRFIESGPGGM